MRRDQSHKVRSRRADSTQRPASDSAWSPPTRHGVNVFTSCCSQANKTNALTRTSSHRLIHHPCNPYALRLELIVPVSRNQVIILLPSIIPLLSISLSLCIPPHLQHLTHSQLPRVLIASLPDISSGLSGRDTRAQSGKQTGRQTGRQIISQG